MNDKQNKYKILKRNILYCKNFVNVFMNLLNIGENWILNKVIDFYLSIETLSVYGNQNFCGFTLILH